MKNFILCYRKIGPIDFNGWLLVNIDFTGSDLRETNFKGAKSERVNVNGAILYKGLELGQVLDDKRLVKLYSKFTKNGEIEKVKALNNIIGFLPLNLKEKNLSNLDLTNINLEFANLNDANLRNTILIGSKLPDSAISEYIPESMLSTSIQKRLALKIKQDLTLKRIRQAVNTYMVILPIILLYNNMDIHADGSRTTKVKIDPLIMLGVSRLLLVSFCPCCDRSEAIINRTKIWMNFTTILLSTADLYHSRPVTEVIEKLVKSSVSRALVAGIEWYYK